MHDVLFDSIDAASEKKLQQHLSSCSGCANIYAEMRKTIELVSVDPAPTMPESYWDGYYGRLMDRMTTSQVRPAWESYWSRIRLWIWSEQGRPAWGLQLALAAILLLLGVLIGQNWQSNPISIPPAQNSGNAALTPAALNDRAERYLDRSSVLLLGLVNVDLAQREVSHLRFDRKQELAGELIHEAGLLKPELEQLRNKQLSRLVEDLEKILLQIANLEQQQDIPSIELIQRGVERGDLLLKINLEKMKIDEERVQEL